MSLEYTNSRIGFRDALIALAEKRSDVVFVSTDSLKIIKAEPFLEKWPDRVVEVGIAEQNGVAVSAGLAACGLKPYLCTYAGFLTMRACEQMRTFVAYPQQQVRFVGVNAGLLGGNREGVTHQFIEDIGILRSIPGFTILCPSDGDQVRQAVLASVDIDGPVYIRIGSGKEERVLPNGTSFEINKIRVLEENGRDILLFCHGFIANRVLAASQELLKQGIKTTVVEVHTLKPIDTTGIKELLASTTRAVTVEDHNIVGGLGSAISEIIAQGYATRLVRVGIQDCYGESGPANELLDAYGLSVRSIINAALSLFTRSV